MLQAELRSLPLLQLSHHCLDGRLKLIVRLRILRVIDIFRFHIRLYTHAVDAPSAGRIILRNSHFQIGSVLKVDKLLNNAFPICCNTYNLTDSIIREEIWIQ